MSLDLSWQRVVMVLAFVGAGVACIFAKQDVPAATLFGIAGGLAAPQLGGKK